MEDGELVRQTLAGGRQAYEELVRRWTGRILAVCHARLGRAEGADDLAQEVLLRGYRSLASLANPDKFGPWLCGIAVHVCLDWLKSKDRTVISFSALDAGHQPDRLPANPGCANNQASDREEDVSELMAKVEGLPDECREVLMLYYYDDVTYRDLAGMLGVSRATINARLTKARSLLRERLAHKVRR